jgi:hypothetical protein
MRVYTVQIQEKYYYDFSVSTIKCGCYIDKDKALQKANSVYKSLCSELEESIQEYADTYGDIADVEEDPNTGYYSIAFGDEEEHEIHVITIDEWEVQ